MGETANHKCSIHHWAVHGIAGRGILLDYRHYAQTNNKPYDPYKTHAITLSELEACAKYQGSLCRLDIGLLDRMPADRQRFDESYRVVSISFSNALWPTHRQSRAGFQVAA